MRENLVLDTRRGPAARESLYGTQAETDAHLTNIPLGRLARKEEIADTCAFLLSDFGGYLTGTEILVDGGRRLTGQ